MGVENIKIGACAVSFGGIDLGYTKGGVTVNIGSSSIPSEAIGHSRHYDHAISDMEVTVDCPLAETTIDTLWAAFPWGRKNGGILSIGDMSRFKLRQYAKELKVTPLNGGDQVIVPMAVPTSNVMLHYAHDSERLIQVTFRALTVSMLDTTLIQIGQIA